MIRHGFLPHCRHRGRSLGDDRYECRSPQLIVPPGGVHADDCLRSCPYVDGDSTPQIVPHPIDSKTLAPVSLALLTAPRNSATVHRTVHELRRAGFQQTLHIFAEPEAPVPEGKRIELHRNRRKLGLWDNWRSASYYLLDHTEADFILICEDDLLLCPAAAPALQHAIATLPHEDWGYASLYTPRHNLEGRHWSAGWQAIDIGSRSWGALGYCYSRESLEAVLNSNVVLQHRSNLVDLVVSQACADLNRRCYFHVPSLAAHAGIGLSSLGHFPQPESTAVRFDYNLRAYVDTPVTTRKPDAQRSAPTSTSRPIVQLAGNSNRPVARSGTATIPQAEAVDVNRLAAIACHYNPCRYRRSMENHLRFRQGLIAAGVELWTIELAFGDSEYELPLDDRTVRVRGGARNIMWQKERLLNLLISRLPHDVDAIAWIDADILFLNPDWPERTRKVLRTHHVVQLFEESHQSTPDGRLEDCRKSVGYAYAFDRPNFTNFSKSHPGFAWAARAGWLRDVGLYERHVTGGADSLMVGGFTGADIFDGRRMNDEWRKAAGRWYADAFSSVRGSLGFVEGAVVHMFHGTQSNRRYVERSDYLSGHGFNPMDDLRVDDNGLLAWTDHALRQKPQMVQQVAEYFFERREDG